MLNLFQRLIEMEYRKGTLYASAIKAAPIRPFRFGNHILLEYFVMIYVQPLKKVDPKGMPKWTPICARQKRQHQYGSSYLLVQFGVHIL